MRAADAVGVFYQGMVVQLVRDIQAAAVLYFRRADRPATSAPLPVD